MGNHLGLIIVIWALLGIHSCWFLIKRYTQDDDFTVKLIWMLIICFTLPLISHFSTAICYPIKRPERKSKILFKKSAKEFNS